MQDFFNEVLTVKSYRHAVKLDGDVSKIETEVIRPVLPQINQITGQENNARYLAYLLKYKIMMNLLNADNFKN